MRSTEEIEVSTPEDFGAANRKPVKGAEEGAYRDQVRRHRMLLELGQIITSEMNLEALFDLIMRQTNAFMNTELCSVFMFDEENEELWSLVSTDLQRDAIRIPADQGVTGRVFQDKKPLIINDAYNDPRFLSEVDKKTGFRTRNILCIPLINREKKCIGTLQTLNKKTGDFTQQDQELLTSASHYVAIALENAKLYEDLKLLDRAKERVINHLSHELKTPLAIIAAVFQSIERRSAGVNLQGLEKTLDRGQRNLKKLRDLQEKIDDILEERSVEEKKKILDIVESAASLLWELGEDQRELYGEVVEYISRRLDSLFDKGEALFEEISVSEVLDEIWEQARSSMGDRELTILRDGEEGLHLTMDRDVLHKVCRGLLKNAIENTPDEGKIVITAKRKGKALQIRFHDYGVGITGVNQPMIFGGFFHTQDTNLYSTKRPYEFGAGGSGSDLLRIRCLAERYGFSIDFNSTRCKYIPDDKDQCPGRISKCQWISGAPECLASGESTFTVSFKQDNSNTP